MDWIIQHLDFFGNGVDQTNILFCLVLLDTILGLCWRLKLGKPLKSKNFFSGIIQNFVPALFPAMLQEMKLYAHGTTLLYSYLSVVIFVLFAWFACESILANFQILGLKLPTFLENWLNNEIKGKLERK